VLPTGWSLLVVVDRRDCRLYDAGVLVAAERNDRQIWADHRVRLELGSVPITTAPVVAQVSRSHRQAQLRRLLRGCDIVAFAPEQAHEVGGLLARATASDVVDAHVIVTAAKHMSTVMTSDPDDLRRLSDQLTTPVQILRV
jgi:predicted nucleic acid-binding protein